MLPTASNRQGDEYMVSMVAVPGPAEVHSKAVEKVPPEHAISEEQEHRNLVTEPEKHG